MRLKLMEFICKYCGKICKNLNSLHCHERLCGKNPNKAISNVVKHNQTVGPWNKGLTKETSQNVKRAAEALHLKYQSGELIAHESPMNDPVIREKHKKKMQEVYRNRIPHAHARSKHGYYKDIWFESSWELMFIVYCLENNIQFERNHTAFSYQYENSIKTYFPDFYLPKTDEYIEIKGVKTEKDIAKWQQFPKKLIVIDEKSNEFKKIRQYIIKQYGKNYYKVLMAV